MKEIVIIALCLGMAAGQALHAENDGDSIPHPDCHSLMESGYTKNGIYRLTLNGSHHMVPCEFRDGFGFTIILNRVDNYVNWARGYTDYVVGFGYPLHDYFSGLTQLHYLTTQFGNTVLETTFLDWNHQFGQAVNGYFAVGDAASGYKLSIGGHYQGNVPDDMSYSNGMQFYTLDHRDPNNCVNIMRGGWWYNHCAKTLPTGHYYNQGPYHTNKTLGDGIFWQDYKGALYSLKKFVMSLRRHS